MNCDQVFDVLTRGPFPTGHASDHHVERHLATCRPCRRLAEALQPAIELFEEAVAPEESYDLPAYSGELFGTMVETPPSPAQVRLVGARPDRSWSRRAQSFALEAWPGVWRLAAAVVLGVLLGDVLRKVGPGIGGDEPPNGAAPLTKIHADDDGQQNRAVAASLGSPLGIASMCKAALRSRVGDQESGLAAIGAPIELADLACCTSCHTSNDRHALPSKQVAMIASSCQSCHDN